MRAYARVVLTLFAAITFAATAAFAIPREDQPRAHPVRVMSGGYQFRLGQALHTHLFGAAVYAAVQHHQQLTAYYEAVAAAERAQAQNRYEAAQRVTATPYEASNGRCGGDLPSCSIMECESGGNIRAENPSSSASGKWQIVDSTWGGYGGYARASDAPEAVQDARARELWAGGSGRSHWVC